MDVWTMHRAISQSNGIITRYISLSDPYQHTGIITDLPKALHIARAAGQVCEVLMWR